MTRSAVSAYYSTGSSIIRFLDGNEIERTPPAALGPTIYSAADIAAWTTGTAYTALASKIEPSGVFGIEGADVTDYGTSYYFDDDQNVAPWYNSVLQKTAGQIKGQACLWAANGGTSRLSNITAFLDGLKDVTSWTSSYAERGQVNLDASWAIINVVQAAQIVGYSSSTLASVLRLAYDQLGYSTSQVGMDWWGSGNWNATFSSARLHIASYLEDQDLWQNALAYLDYHIQRAIYHSAYDGQYVVPYNSYIASFEDRLLDTSPDAGATRQAWRYEMLQNLATPPAQYSNHTPGAGSWSYAGDLVDGTDNEAKRDLTHSMMTLAGYAQCALVAKNVGHVLEAHILDRISAAAEYMADRCLYYMNTGSHRSNPTPLDGTGGGYYLYPWAMIARALPDNLHSDIGNILNHPTYKAVTGVHGDLHMTAHPYADGTRLPDFVLGLTKPTEDNTGIRSPTTSTSSGGILYIDTDGTEANPVVWRNVRFERRVVIRAEHNHFIDCQFVGPTAGDYANPLVDVRKPDGTTGTRFEFCTFRQQATDAPFSRCLQGGNYTAYRCDLSGAADCILAHQGDITVLGCYLHDMWWGVGEWTGTPDDVTHNDCVQFATGGYQGNRFEGNHFEASIDPSLGDYNATDYPWYDVTPAEPSAGYWGGLSSFMFSPGANTVEPSIQILNNWIEGGVVGLNMAEWTGTRTGVIVTGNRWGRDFRDQIDGSTDDMTIVKDTNFHFGALLGNRYDDNDALFDQGAYAGTWP